MFASVLGSVFLVLIVPLAAWALVALTTWPGRVLAVALLACAAGWLSLMTGWAAPDQVANIMLALVTLTPALIMTGRLADRVAVIRRAPPARVRIVTAHSVPAVCVGLNVLVLVILVLTTLYLDLDYTPPSSDVLPLPAALTVVSDTDHGCPGGPPDRCEREIDITGAGGLSVDRAAQIVTTALAGPHRWRLSPGQSGCRYEGWLLGRENVCVQVETDQNVVQVLLLSEP
jgi:hypothetical protein